MNDWQEIHNATADYLDLKKMTTVVRTLLLDKGHLAFDQMIKWCKKFKNVKGSWGPETSDDDLIKFRFWREDEAQKFIKRFKKYIDNPETANYP